MKTIIKFIFGLVLIAACVNTQAQEQYQATTLWNYSSLAGTDAIVVGGTSNLAASVTATKFDQFVLEVRTSSTNSGNTTTLGYVLAWQTSADGSNWGTVEPNTRHWFTIPATNAISTVWSTNITLNSVGYWRVNWFTNNGAQHLTNVQIKAWVKPKRQGNYP